MNRRSSSRGFTLVEVLVATAITVLLGALVLSVVMSTLRVWTRAQARFASDTEAMLVLDQLERDLQAACGQDNGRTWLAADIIHSSAGLVKHGWLISGRMKPAGGASQNVLPAASGSTPPSITEARFGLSGVWLRFLTTNVETRTDSNPGGSLPVVVAYQICRRPVSGDIVLSNPAAVRYSLFRSAVKNDETFATGLDVTSAGYTSASAAPTSSRRAATVMNPAKVDVMATNVADFGVWLCRRGANGELVRLFPSAPTDATHAAGGPVEAPVVADVMVRVLTEEGARLVAAIESGAAGLARPAELASDDDWWWATVEAHSRVYVRRIEILGGEP
jgi:prepilin-type N-terminal cleavage/methylation domain-containing protein